MSQASNCKSPERESSRRDEASPSTPRELSIRPQAPESEVDLSSSRQNPDIVDWDGPSDPANPKNWSTGRKAAGLLTVAMFTFISPVSSSMVAPSTPDIARELGISSDVVSQMVLSAFVLAYAIGPLFLGPLSEVYGRVIVLQLANLFYLVFNAACGGAKDAGMMIAFRFLSGLGGSCSLAIGGGVLSDMFDAKDRGKAVAIYSLMPLLGPVVGPIAGGFITLKTTWRWSFYATSIVDAAIQVAGLFLLRETYGPVILQKKAARQRIRTGNLALHTKFDSAEQSVFAMLGKALGRPFRLLCTQPIVQFAALYMGYLYGLMYLVLATFPSVFQSSYGENVGVAGLNYISLGVGFFLGIQVSAPLNDKIYRILKEKNGHGQPEFRIPIMLPGSLLVPAGLFIYGWTTFFQTHWIGPNIGAAVFAAGVMVNFTSIQTYLIDAYTLYAASAVSVATVVRSLAGFAFPLFAPQLYEALGLGWGNSSLGFLGLALGLPAPVLLWSYGAKLREKSRFAAGSGNAESSNVSQAARSPQA